MKRLLIFIYILLATLSANAQAVGTWKQFRAYGYATDQVIANGQVFCLASGNLFAYDLETSEIQTFDKGNGLNGYGISFMDYDDVTHTLVLVYADGLIDIMDVRTMEVTCLTALRNANVSNKTTNAIFIHDGYLWLAMGFGFIKVNLIEGHFEATYDIKQNVQSAAVCNGALYYCISGGGMYKALLSDNLHDNASHKRLNNLNFSKLVTNGTSIYCLGWNSFYRFDTKNGGFAMSKVESGQMMISMRRSGDELLACYETKVFSIDAEGKVTTIPVAIPGLRSISYDGKKFWASCGLGGLQEWSMGEDGVLYNSAPGLIPNSPRYDTFYRMNYAGDRLLVAGGSHATYGGMASYYENGTWTNLDTVLIGKEEYKSISGIVQHPNDPSIIYATSGGHGIYVYREGRMEERYSVYNSPLRSALPSSSRYYNYVLVEAPTFDTEGNLWMLNSQTDTVVWRFSPETGKWKGLYFEELDNTSSAEKIIFDSDGRMWVYSRWLDKRGVMCYDTNSKRHRMRVSVEQQDGQKYEINNFLCMTMDKNEHIWVGTDVGLFVVDNPDKFLDEDFTYTQIKVNRKDGSGLADYLFSGAYVSAIAVDGGNRKWIGTLGGGVYLISPDGQETIHHFTADNSPLPDNDVREIAVNPHTGEVMIATMGGLVSYMSDATEPEEDLDEDNIVIYPNPVRPEYEGDVIIRGLAADCEVKIATVGGQVVWNGVSVGGTATWNCQRKGGGRVATGVYNVIINTADASNVIVGRLAVIR